MTSSNKPSIGRGVSVEGTLLCGASIATRRTARGRRKVLRSCARHPGRGRRGRCTSRVRAMTRPMCPTFVPAPVPSSRDTQKGDRNDAQSASHTRNISLLVPSFATRRRGQVETGRNRRPSRALRAAHQELPPVMLREPPREPKRAPPCLGVGWARRFKESSGTVLQ